MRGYTGNKMHVKSESMQDMQKKAHTGMIRKVMYKDLTLKVGTHTVVM